MKEILEKADEYFKLWQRREISHLELIRIQREIITVVKENFERDK